MSSQTVPGRLLADWLRIVVTRRIEQKAGTVLLQLWLASGALQLLRRTEHSDEPVLPRHVGQIANN